MTLSRRDLVKIGIAGGAAVAVPWERVAFSSSSATRMADSAKVKPFTLPFVRPPELQPVGMTGIACFDGQVREYPRYVVNQTFAVADIMPGFKTPIFGYNGITPGPT